MPLGSQLYLRTLRIAVLLVGAVVGVPGDAMSPQRGGGLHRDAIDGVAPAALVASGFSDLSGVAAEHRGALLVTDRVAGTLTRLYAAGAPEVVLRDLHRPQGVAVSDVGEVFVLEAGAGCILQVGSDGRSLVLAQDLTHPEGLAIGPDSTIWVAAHGQRGGRVFRVEPSGQLTEVISGLSAVRALAVSNSALFIATGTSVERVRLHPDGSAGTATSILRGWHATALIADRLGDVYIGGWPVGTGGARRAGILKYESDSGRTTRFATGVRQPSALGFAPWGDLLAGEGSPHGRLWRFSAPPAPVTSLPRFTNQSPIALTGTAERGSRVQAFTAGVVQAAANADELTGQFSITFALEPNSATAVILIATAAGGAGLAGAPAARKIVHDDHPPRLTLTSPVTAAYVRDTVMLAATATDEGSRIASIRFLLDDTDVGGEHAADGDSRLTTDALVDVARTVEGMHTFTAIAEDRAGNQASAGQLVIIDRTPPETALFGHPAREITDGDVTFTFVATDLLSPVLEFSWRLDAAEWSPYQAETSAAVEQLEAGSHLFEVRARDLAGNEDVTPARWEFQVRALHVSVAEPTAGSIVTTPAVWIRGAAGGTPPVTVSIPLPPELRVFAATISAPVVNGGFAVELPVLPGDWSVAVTATDGTGATATQRVDIFVQDAVTPRAVVMAVPAAGFAPHRVQFGTASLPLGMYAIDLDSDGNLDYTGERPDGPQFTYTTPGVFLATIAAVIPGGTTLQWRSAVTVYDRTALEHELRHAWNGLKDALRNGEAEQAAAFLHTGRRDIWRGYFAELATAVATDIDAILTDIDVVGFEGDYVECEMMRAVDGLMFSFPVSFAIDTDGRWRIWQF